MRHLIQDIPATKVCTECDQEIVGWEIDGMHPECWEILADDLSAFSAE